MGRCWVDLEGERADGRGQILVNIGVHQDPRYPTTPKTARIVVTFNCAVKSSNILRPALRPDTHLPLIVWEARENGVGEGGGRAILSADALFSFPE